MIDQPYDYHADKRKAMDRKMEKVTPCNRYNWCEPSGSGCACRGCVNNSGGITDYEGWKDWVARNPEPAPVYCEKCGTRKYDVGGNEFVCCCPVIVKEGSRFLRNSIYPGD